MSSKQNVWPIAGILSGALVWGLIWYPYRILQEAGVPGSLATLLTYLCALLFSTVLLPRIRDEFSPHHILKIQQPLRAKFRLDWWVVALALSAGWSNLGYVLGVLHGEVMRVLLLFYLAPLWTILFSYALLGERLNRYGYLVIALSFGGAVVMLWRPQLGLPLPQTSAEWIGLSAGMSFALSNVVSRRAAHVSVTAKSSSVLLGTAILSLPLLLWESGLPARVLAIEAGSWLIIGLLGVVLCATSFAVQHGLARLVANRVVVLFLFELVFAAIASYFLVNEAIQLRDALGALLIISASLLSGKLGNGKTVVSKRHP